MHTNNFRGFIPLVVMILLGLVAVVGGIIVAVSIHNSKPTGQPSEQVEVESGVITPALTPVSPRVASSSANTISTPNTDISTTVKQITPILDSDTKAICDQVFELESSTTEQSSQDIVAWCRKLGQSAIDTSDQELTWKQLMARVKKAWAMEKRQERLDSVHTL